MKRIRKNEENIQNKNMKAIIVQEIQTIQKMKSKENKRGISGESIKEES